MRKIESSQRKVEEPNFLYEMDQITQSIIAAVLDAQNTGFIGDITVPKTSQKISGILLLFSDLSTFTSIERYPWPSLRD